MHFNLGLGKNYSEEAIKLLNVSARSFYNGEHTYRDIEYPIALKAAMQTGFVDLERVLRGTFDSGLHLDNADSITLVKMFPNACQNMFKIEKPGQIKQLGFLLEGLRDINSHAIVSDNDSKWFDLPFSFLKAEKCFNKGIYYYKNEITVAGVIYILLNFLREQSIRNLVQKDSIFALVSCGYYRPDEGERFVETISHVNLEIGIRKTAGQDIFTSVCGEYAEIMEQNGHEFQMKIGKDPHPTYDVKGSIEENKITIRRFSLTKTFYDSDYTLVVEDINGFIELSNMLPPLVLVDYLHACGIVVFDDAVCDQITENQQRVLKLNYPKYYVDKNLEILLMPETVSDFRFISSLISDGLQRVFLLIEQYIYSQKNIDKQGGFSSVLRAIKEVDADPTLSLDVAVLRNMVSHGYILDEYFIFETRNMVYSVSFIISVLKQMLDLFKTQDTDMYEFFGNTIGKYLISKLVVGKYRQASKFCESFMAAYPEYDRQGHEKKTAFIEHSMIDMTRFNCLMTEKSEVRKVIRIAIENISKPLYLLDSDKERQAMERFCAEHAFEVYDKQDNGIILDWKLRLKDR